MKRFNAKKLKYMDFNGKKSRVKYNYNGEEMIDITDLSVEDIKKLMYLPISSDVKALSC